MSGNNKAGAKPTRRAFLGGTATGIVGGALIAGAYATVESKSDDWDTLTDIVVVGAGAAGCSAAITAHELGKQVLVLEKGPAIGGTAAKSVGGVWVPANAAMQEAGIEDERDDCLRYMARLSFPEHFDPSAEHFGATPEAFRLLEAYYDNARRVTESLQEVGALKLIAEKFNGNFMPDYFAHLPENTAPTGRCLFVGDEAGNLSNGAEMMRRFAASIADRGIEVRIRTSASQLVMDSDGAVIGVVATGRDGEPVRIGARDGVIFASGGFTHDADLRRQFLKGPVFGGCAAPTNQGDFVRISAAAGAQLGNMQNAWWAQLPVEQALENSSVPTGIWCTPGDSMIQVNAQGSRFMNEKFVYNERTQAHFEWDPVNSRYPNLLSFMIYDQRTAEQYAGFSPIPPKDTTASHVIEAASIPDLANRIAARLEQIGSKTGGFGLETDFVTNLESSIDRYNRLAAAGSDTDFGRGDQPIDRFFHFFGPGLPSGLLSNPTMHPISSSGPYYAIILAAGTLDTKGGPIIDEKARVLDGEGQAIKGLYAAGNCSAGCAGPAYWAGGATLGPAITFGAIAAETAAAG